MSGISRTPGSSPLQPIPSRVTPATPPVSEPPVAPGPEAPEAPSSPVGEDQSTVRTELQQPPEPVADPEVSAAVDRTRAAAADQGVSPAELESFRAGELPAEPAALGPEDFGRMGQTLAQQAEQFQLPRRAPAQQQALDEMRTTLQTRADFLRAAPTPEGAQELAQIESTLALVNGFDQLDQARRATLDAPNLTQARARMTEQEAAQTAYAAAVADAEAFMPEGFSQSSTQNLALANRDLEDLRTFIDNPDAGTTGMMRALDRGGYTETSRFDNYSRFIRMRTDRHQFRRTRENETLNPMGYTQSLRNDLADSEARRRQYSQLSGDIQTANPPLSREQISGRVRRMLSTESGRELVVSRSVFSSLEASFQAEGDLARARNLQGQADQGLSTANASLVDGGIALSQRDMERSRTLLDQARTQRDQAGRDRAAAGDELNSARQNVRIPLAGGLPPAERADRQAAQRSVQGGIADVEAQGRRFDAEAGAFDNNLQTTETNYRETEAEIAEEQRRLADIDRRLAGTPYREELKGFLENVMSMQDSGIVELGATARLGVGTPALSLTGGLGLNLAAEKAWGQGSSFTLRAEMTVSAELRADVGFMAFKAGIDATLREGIHMRDEEEAAEFVMRLSDVATAYTRGDVGDIRQATAAFSDFMGDRRFTGTGNSVYGNGRVGTADGPNVSAGARSSDETSQYWGVDANRDGEIDNRERRLRVEARDTDAQIQVGAGGFTATVGQRSSVVTHSDDPRVSVGDRSDMTYVEVGMSPAVLRRVAQGEQLSGVLAGEISAGLRQYGVIMDTHQIGQALDAAQRGGELYRSTGGSSQQIIVGIQIENGRAYPIAGYDYERTVGGMAQSAPGVVAGLEGRFHMAGRRRLGIEIPVSR